MLLRAFAKINLGLRILGKRDDGFHELRTVFQTIDWCDEISLCPSRRFRFVTSDGPSGEDNLVVRAVRAFEQVTGRTAKVEIHLDKKIPTGAGLGGGSADAAVTFLGLQKLFEINISMESAQSVLSALGSDVPFFTLGGRALGTGRGNQIETLADESDYWLVMVQPGFSIATAEGYSWLTLSDKTNTIGGFRSEFVSGSEHVEWVNDFEAPVFGRHPLLAEIRNELSSIGAFRAALSGSGSVVFGQFRDEAKAAEAASTLRRRFDVKVVRPLTRAEYVSRIVEE